MHSSRSARCWDFETSRGIDFRLPIRDAEGNPYTLISIGDSTFVRLTLETTDHMLGDQWIARWNPGAVGTHIILR